MRKGREPREERIGEASLGELVSAFVSRADDGAGSGTRRALRAWLSANGDRERDHTIGVYLREDERGDTLIVYVDSSSALQDFTVKRHLYVGRLEAAGLPVADVSFKLSRYRRRRRDDAPADRDEGTPLPELDAATLSRLAEEVSPLPPALREAAYEALSSMEAAGRAEDTRNS